MDWEVQEIKDQIFNLLSYRERSSYELRERLLRKGYKKEKIEETIDHLVDYGYINDEEFAYKWIRNRLKHKPRGKNLLIKELYSKGIEREIVEKALNDLLDPEKELEMGIALALKWLNSNEKDINKLKRYLYNKGFSLNLINKILISFEDKKSVNS